MLDKVMRDVRFTWRSFRRAPLTFLTIVATVALGLGLVAVVFTILNAYVFRVDEVRNPHELFAVERQGSPDAAVETFTRQEYEALVRETGVFSDACATTPDVYAWIDGRRREGRLVTGNFFDVLGVRAARGRTLTPVDDEPGRPPVIVLSHRAWVQYFASDSGVLDRTLRVNGALFEVVGVMPEGFRGLEPVAAPGFWAPLSLGHQLRLGQAPDQSVGVQIIGRLKPGVSREQAVGQLAVWDSHRVAAATVGERPPARLTLEPRPGTIPLSIDAMVLFVPLFFAFGLILMIGCANVANLLLARGLARQREIGIRFAIGASRGRVLSQLLVESVLLALVSAAFAFGISRLVLVAFVYTLTTTFPPDIGNLRLVVPPADWRVALFLVGGALVSTLFFALAPALRATRVELVRAIRGEVVRDGRPGRARDALVAVQVTGSVVLLISAAIFLRSSWAAAAVDPGIRTAGILSVKILDEQRRAAILEAVRSEALVDSVAASWPGGVGGLGAFPSRVEGGSGTSTVPYRLVSPEYFDIFGIDLVRGRVFDRTERTPDAAVAVVSESLARQLWPGLEAVGQVLRVEPDASLSQFEGQGQARAPGDPLLLSRTVVVVGVARDVAGFRIGGVRLGEAGVYMPIGEEAGTTSLTMRVHGESGRARQALLDRLAAIDPNAGEVSTMQTIASAEVYLLGIPFWLTFVLGALALVLTLSGLFSVVSYVVQQRTREIGVRMALGATRRSIAALVLAQSARPVGLGLVLGSSVTAALGALLLATPSAQLIGSTVRLFDPAAYAAGLVWIAAACTSAALVPALRAARTDPMAALRQE